MTLIYIFIYLIFFAYIYSTINYIFIVRKINRQNSGLSDIPLIFKNKKVNGFTIEKTELLHSQATFAIDVVTYYFIKLAAILGFKYNPYLLIKKYAYTIAINKVIRQADHADYLVNLKIKNIIFNNRYVSCSINATAVHMYEDTLPLFNIPELHKKEEKLSLKIYVYNFFKGFFLLLLGLYIVNWATSTFSSYLAKNTTYELEKKLWSYIEPVVLQKKPSDLVILEEEKRIEDLLKDLPKTPLNKYYEFKFHIIDSEEVDSIPFPAGNIVFTKGLVNKLESKNEIIFLLAHEIGHYENNDHLKSLGNNYLTMYLAAKAFKNNSLIGRLFIGYRDFSESAFTEVEEYAADEYALWTVQGIFGNISGLDTLEYKAADVIESYQPIIRRHPFPINRIERLKKNILAHDLKKDKPIYLNNFILNEADNSKIIPGELSLNDKYLKQFNQYKMEIISVYNDYEQTLKTIDNILIFEPDITYNELTLRKNKLNFVIDTLHTLKDKYEEVIKNNDLKFNAFFLEIDDLQQSLILKALWRKEKIVVNKSLNFYFERDIKILKIQKNAIDYLINRFNSFKVTEYGLEFSSKKEDSDYHDFINSINNLLKQIPPFEKS